MIKLIKTLKAIKSQFFLKLRNKNLIQKFADMKINQSSEQLNQSTFIFQSTASNRF